MSNETRLQFNDDMNSPSQESINSPTALNKKPLKKFKSQSVNNLFKQSNQQPSQAPLLPKKDSHSSLHLQSAQLPGTHLSTTSSNGLAAASTSSIGYSLLLQSVNANKNGIKTLSLASGQKLKIIPEKRLLTPLGSNNNNNSPSAASPFTSKLVDDDNNYWKKSRSTSPDTKKDKEKSKIPDQQQPKKVESSRFTFSNLSLPPSTSGFNWADIDDEEDDSFNDKIWSSLTPQVNFPNNSNTNTSSKDSTINTTNPDILSTPSMHLHSLSFTSDHQQFPQQSQQPSIMSPGIEKTNNEMFSPLGDQGRPANTWGNTSPLLEFRRHTSSSLSFNEQESSALNDSKNNNYFNTQNNFNRYSASALSSSFDKLTFHDNGGSSGKFVGSEPVKQELFNPVTGKIEVFTTTPPQQQQQQQQHQQQHSNPKLPPHHHSFDSSYINHNSSNKLDFWKTSSTVWNSRENSLSNTLPSEEFKAFSPNLNDPVTSSPAWSGTRNNSDSITDGTLTTPNTLRGLSRFFPSPMTEHQNEYFPQQQQQQPQFQGQPNQMKRHASDPFDPLSAVPQSYQFQQLGQQRQQLMFPKPSNRNKTAGELLTRSQPLPDTTNPDDESEIEVSLPPLKKQAMVSTSKDTIEQFVLGETTKHPEGFSSTFYKRGVNNFMFVRELQSKVAINKIRGYDYAEFRINIPISQTSMESLTANQDPEHPSRIKRSYIINIEVRELEGRKPFSSGTGTLNSRSSNSSSSTNTYIRPGYNRTHNNYTHNNNSKDNNTHNNNNNKDNNTRRGSNVYIRKGL